VTNTSVGISLLAVLLLPGCSNKTSFPKDAAPGELGPAPEASGPPPDAYQNPCAPNPAPSISGRVYAPNGIDPVAGAVPDAWATPGVRDVRNEIVVSLGLPPVLRRAG
jgi:hypothetical protein